MVRVYTKDVGEVKDRFDKSVGCNPGLEDANEEYIKRELKIK